MGAILPLATVPTDVRAAGADAVATYKAALGFEQVLLRRLTASLASTTGSEDEGDSASSAFADLVPDALAEQLASSGGLGLARELYRSFHSDAPGAPTTPTRADR
jgi:Rod binding domain-containing protein